MHLSSVKFAAYTESPGLARVVSLDQLNHALLTERESAPDEQVFRDTFIIGRQPKRQEPKEGVTHTVSDAPQTLSEKHVGIEYHRPSEGMIASTIRNLSTNNPFYLVCQVDPSTEMTLTTSEQALEEHTNVRFFSENPVDAGDGGLFKLL